MESDVGVLQIIYTSYICVEEGIEIIPEGIKMM